MIESSAQRTAINVVLTSRISVGRMKRFFVCLVIARMCLMVRAEKLTFVPQWTPQAQFAGYYVAQELGFYADEGLEVTILHVGLNSSMLPLDVLLEGNAQIIGMQLAQAIVARSDGAPIANILQTSQNSGLMCVVHKPVAKPEDLNGMKIATWTSGYSEAFDIMARDNHLDVKMIPSMQCTNLYLFDAVDATLCYAYNEYLELLRAKGGIADEQLMRISDMGYNYPEDGLYTSEEWLSGHADMAARFVKASIRGWLYCHDHPDKALEVVMKVAHENNIPTSDVHQKMMLEEVLRQQVNRDTGVPDFHPVTRNCFEEMTRKMLKNWLFENEVTYDEIIYPLSVAAP